jgi:phage terminase small subunit
MVDVDATETGLETATWGREPLPLPLTAKQERFVDAYLGEARGDASRAAQLAGYKRPEKLGLQLLKTAKVRRHLPPEVVGTLPEARERTTADRPVVVDKYEAFVMAYTGHARFNAKKAAVAAGYAPSTGPSKLLHHPVIRARINAHLEAMSMSSQEVLAELTEVARRDLSECIEVRTTSKGVVTARMDASAKMKALELLGKAHGLFAERVHHAGSIRREYVIVNEPAEGRGSDE